MNKLNLKNKKQGFTIIEVVLVLAIAGLIFLIVFLALPGLQRSRRDTQRKSDVGKVIAQLSNYGSNNNGSIPSSATTPTDAEKTFLTTYLDFTGASCTAAGGGTNCDSKAYNDPSSTDAYAFDWTGTVPDSSTIKTGTIYVSPANKQCKSDNSGFETGTGGYAVLTHLETGGNYCQAG